MQIQRNGSINDIFAQQLKSRLAKKEEEGTTEEQLADAKDGRDPKKTEENGEKTEEELLASDRKPEETKETGEKLTEEQLDKERKASGMAPVTTAGKAATTEQLLNEDAEKNYPHRNQPSETGEKRPINALKEELGKNSDESRDERYKKEREKKAGFNLSQKKLGSYMQYKASPAKFASVKQLDESIEKILVASKGRTLTTDEEAVIAGLKQQKAKALGIK